MLVLVWCELLKLLCVVGCCWFVDDWFGFVVCVCGWFLYVVFVG